MDIVKNTFDMWAKNGKSEEMQEGHIITVTKFLNSIKFEKNFSFLDVGCGNGWTVRKISTHPKCKKAVGIDKSTSMIKNANSKISSNKEKFFLADIEKWNDKEKFDVIFSMESLYYTVPMESSLEEIFKRVKSNGVFYCGTDFYIENKDTIRWIRDMKMPMDLRSKSEWREMFKKAGFNVKIKQIKDQKSKTKWKRNFGTLFVIGSKP